MSEIVETGSFAADTIVLVGCVECGSSNILDGEVKGCWHCAARAVLIFGTPTSRAN